ncbi:RDD protein [Sulfuricella denitrificans skB26]|uniref:RDD protein n=1 Tax=Sulfuricella denitrificans (strain DSM 22764 / NBRC 105220 / skB26) TaxID=1163617 RepID=S6A9T2_SULDS|nr:RDD family protein [Sulfuricella denitrificans]BAN34655.1 RDD protein [Sulfuricella denitrificans skB26]
MTLPTNTPGITRRLASMLYESLLLTAVLFIAGFIFTTIFHSPLSPILRFVFQIYLLLVMAFYFIGYWMHGGQTLPMKTWHLRIVCTDGQPLSLKQACLRFLLATIGVGLGFGILWALFDREHLFWHDRMAGTKVVISNE